MSLVKTRIQMHALRIVNLYSSSNSFSQYYTLYMFNLIINNPSLISFNLIINKLLDLKYLLNLWFFNQYSQDKSLPVEVFLQHIYFKYWDNFINLLQFWTFQVCCVEFDRKDIKMNKLVATCLESKFHVYDLQTQHPEKGFAKFTEKVFIASLKWDLFWLFVGFSYFSTRNTFCNLVRDVFHKQL